MFNVTSIQVSVRLSVPPEQQFLPALVANLSLMPGACMHVCSVVSNYLQPMDSSPPVSSVHELSRKEYGVGCHLLLQGSFPIQGSNPHLLCLLHWQADFLPLSHLGSLMPGTEPEIL